MDRFALPFLGRCRGWMVVTQLLLGMALIVLGQINPSAHPWEVGFSKTQYALLSRLMGIPRAVLATPTGYIAAWLGWSWFFVFCTLAAIPGYLLLPRIAPWRERLTQEQYYASP